MIIAIDGPAASGKGTLGKRLAAHYVLRHLDSGLLYRAVAKAVLDTGRPADDRGAAIAAAKALDPTRIDEAALGLSEGTEPPALDASTQRVRAAGVLLNRSADPLEWAKEHLADGKNQAVYSI